MIVIVGLVVLLIAVLVAIVGVLGNSGTAHPLNDTFSVFGYHVTGSTGTLFVFGMLIGAIAMLGLSVLLAGARRTAGRGQDARRDLAQSQHEAAFANHDRELLLERRHQPEEATGHRNRPRLFGHRTPAHRGSSIDERPPVTPSPSNTKERT